MIHAVLFDLDDTLLDFQSSENAAIRQTLTFLGLPADDETAALYHRINETQWKLLETGELTREQVLTRRFRLLFEELGADRSPEETWHIYEKALAAQHHILPQALPLLEELYPRYDLYLVSNGTASVQDSRIAATGIGRFFKKQFISQRVGFEKPDPRFFDCCFAVLPGLNRKEALIVGDSLTSDIKGGLNAGVPTCWFNPRHKPARPDIPPDYEIDALSKLPELLKKLE